MRRIFLLIMVVIFFAACNRDESTNPDPQTQIEDDIDLDTSSWAIVQNKIFNTECISCHVAGNSFAKQSNLILTADVAYEQLIDRDPNNEAARTDGLKLLGTEGLVSLNSSFLWEKINARDRAHFYNDHPYYGAQMPLGPTPLTNGQLDFIKEWILAGAPKTGHVANKDLLLDTSRYEVAPFQALDSPGQGYQFHIAPFDVGPNEDKEIFFYQDQISNEDIFIHKVDIIMREGSHHFLAYTFNDQISSSELPEPGVIRNVYNANGTYNFQTLIPTQYHQFLTGTQWPLMNYTFPPGVALRLPAGKGLDLNSHYANKTGETIKGEVYMNLHTLEENDVQYVAEMLELNNTSFILPAGEVTTLEKTYLFNEKRNIFQLFSHAHEHMTEFRVYVVGGARDGELVYISTDWEHPPILELTPPLVLNAGQGLRLVVTYDNDEDTDLTFGLRSTDEMMILFGAYY